MFPVLTLVGAAAGHTQTWEYSGRSGKWFVGTKPGAGNWAKQIIAQTNVAVENSGSVINKDTKVATNDFTVSNDEASVVSLNKGELATKRKKYHYGVNKVTYHWNYIRVYLNKTTTQAVAAGAVGGVGALIANYVSGGLATFAVGAISSSVSALVGSSIKGGVWVDYNFLARTVTSCGWQ